MYFLLNGINYYWDGKYWREQEGQKASEEIAEDLNNSYPKAQDGFLGDPGDRIFVHETVLYFYEETTDEFRNPLRPGMGLPRRVEDALRRMLAEPEEETLDYDSRGQIQKAAIAAKDEGRFSIVENLCRLSFEKFDVDPMLAAMYCRALRKLNRSREAADWAWKYKDKKWSHLLASLTGAITDYSRTKEDLEKAEEILDLYKKSGGDGLTIYRLKKGIDKRWREIK